MNFFSRFRQHNYSYNSNGNLLTLHRNGQVDAADPPIAIDDLVYTYDEGNQLQNVVDQERHPDGYNDRNPDVRDPDFKYDNYDNLIADRDKGIKKTIYNHLNLPVKIVFENGGEIDYIYACPPFLAGCLGS